MGQDDRRRNPNRNRSYQARPCRTVRCGMTKPGHAKPMRSYRIAQPLLDILATVAELRSHPDRPITMTDVLEGLIETLSGEAKWAELIKELEDERESMS